jgi:hypothetical protein
MSPVSRRKPTLDELRTLRDKTVNRLNEGDKVIRQGKRDNVAHDAIEKWETGWINLLRDYERLCQQITAMGGDPHD